MLQNEGDDLAVTVENMQKQKVPKQKCVSYLLKHNRTCTDFDFFFLCSNKPKRTTARSATSLTKHDLRCVCGKKTISFKTLLHGAIFSAICPCNTIAQCVTSPTTCLSILRYFLLKRMRTSRSRSTGYAKMAAKNVASWWDRYPV